MTKALKDPEWKVRKAAADSLGNYPGLGDQVIPALLSTVYDDNIEVRGAVIIALGKLGKGSSEVEDQLRTFLADPNPAMRIKAAGALTLQGATDESTIALLIEGLGDKDSATARSASMALAKLTQQFPDKVAEAIGEALAKNSEPLLTNTLKHIRASKTENDSVLVSLTKAYDKAPPKVRILVIATMMETDPNGDKAISVVTKALKDQDASVRKEALKATTRYGTKLDSFRPALLAALKDPDPETRMLAVQAIKGFSSRMPEAGPKLVALADKDPDQGVKTAALATLGSFNDASNKIIRLLEKNAANEDTRMRAACVSSLGNLVAAHSQAVTPILERLLKAEEDRKIKQMIVYNLHRAGKKTPYDDEMETPGVLRAGEDLGGTYH